MDEIAEWRALRREFSELHERINYLEAIWYPPSWNSAEPWMITRTNDDHLKSQFRALAERAAVLMGHSGGPGSLFAWLDYLKEANPRFHFVRHELSRDDGTIESDRSGVIINICAASMECCYRLETLAIAHEKCIQNSRNVPDTLPVPPEPQPKTESIGTQINRLRTECGLTVEELAEAVEIDARSVYRHLSDQTKPYARYISAYQRVFSKLLKRQIVISKMS
jgi:DNA-binding XRE family transcriptional regulator